MLLKVIYSMPPWHSLVLRRVANPVSLTRFPGSNPGGGVPLSTDLNMLTDYVSGTTRASSRGIRTAACIFKKEVFGMREIFKNTEVGIKYAFLVAFLGIGTMTSSIMYSVEPIWDDLVLNVAAAGGIMLLFSLLFIWDLLASKSWHKLAGLAALIWMILMFWDIISVLREILVI